MSEDTAESLLSTDLGSVDVSYPVLKECTTQLLVSEITREPTKAQDGELLVIVYVTEAMLMSKKGVEVPAGHKLTDRISLTPKGKRTKESVIKDLARFRQACVGKTPGPILPLDQYLGQTVDAKIGIEIDETGKYDDKNSIRLIVKD